MQRLGNNAHPFSMEVTHLAPPSVQLVPAKEYNGAPIGTSYDIRVYIGKKIVDKNQNNEIKFDSSRVFSTKVVQQINNNGRLF